MEVNTKCNSKRIQWNSVYNYKVKFLKVNIAINMVYEHNLKQSYPSYVVESNFPLSFSRFVLVIEIVMDVRLLSTQLNLLLKIISASYMKCFNAKAKDKSYGIVYHPPTLCSKAVNISSIIIYETIQLSAVHSVINVFCFTAMWVTVQRNSNKPLKYSCNLLSTLIYWCAISFCQTLPKCNG